MSRKYTDTCAAMVSNWRSKAKIPDTISNEAIYRVVDDFDLHYTSNMSDEEVLEQLNILRNVLELEDLEEL